MLLKEINPFVRQIIMGGVGSADTDFSNDIFMTLKTNDCRLFYITGGTGEIIIEDTPYAIYPGCAVMFQSGTKYVWNTKKATFIVVNFDYTNNFSYIVSPFHPIKSEIYKDSFTMENIVFSDATFLNKPLYLRDAYSIEYLLQNMSSFYYLDEEFVPEILSAYMKSVIITMARAYCSMKNSSEKSSDKIAEKVIQFIQSNYSQKIDSSDIAKLFHFNPSYINRVFKEHTGITIHKFLVNYRINIAKELLRTQNDPIYSIAQNVGFSDIPHFVKSFKKSTNQTPLAYRNSFK